MFKTSNFLLLIGLGLLGGLVWAAVARFWDFFSWLFVSAVVFYTLFSLFLIVYFVKQPGKVLDPFGKFWYAVIFGEWVNILVGRLTLYHTNVNEPLFGLTSHGWPFKSENHYLFNITEFTGNIFNFIFWVIILRLFLEVLDRFFLNKKK